MSEDGKAGFDFLGHHIRQYPAGKYQSDRNSQGRILGFDTLITPSLKASKAHQEEIGRLIRKHRCAPQAALIKHLNPVIRGWASYYTNSDAQSVGELSKQDNLVYLKRNCSTRAKKGGISRESLLNRLISRQALTLASINN
ncbi:group II intron maturase-specific domain-containing protein [Microcoleus sp. B4-D4]